MDLGIDYTALGGRWNGLHRYWEWSDEEGRRHRVDGPAYINTNGSQSWWLHGLLHRTGGPAATHADGRQEWYQHGQVHREDGPAVIYADGSQGWCVHGELHRLIGPAVIRPDGTQGWYVQGRDITTEVTTWIQEHNIAWPFTDKQAMEFALRWG